MSLFLPYFCGLTRENGSTELRIYGNTGCGCALNENTRANKGIHLAGGDDTSGRENNARRAE